MIIDNDKKVAGICVAKTGSTSLRKIFNHLPPDPPPEIYHMFLSDALVAYPHIKEYFKFAFVRDPYTRVHSVYCDFKHSLGGKAHKWATELKKCNSFEEFVLGLETRTYKDYKHLRPQSEYLKVEGSIELDFLGRYENYESDCRKLFSILGMTVGQLPYLRASEKKEACIYTDSMKKVMQKVYVEDYESFGYEK